jgi:hypothetical protein
MPTGNKPAKLPLSFIQASELGKRLGRSSRDETLGRFGKPPEAIEAAVGVAEASARHGKALGVVLEEGDDRVPIKDAGRDAHSDLS